MGCVARDRGTGLELLQSFLSLLLSHGPAPTEKATKTTQGESLRFHFCKKQPLNLLDFDRNGSGAVSVAKKASQNHRILGLEATSGVQPPPAQGHLEQVTQERTQVGLECLQRGKLHQFPGHLLHLPFSHRPCTATGAQEVPGPALLQLPLVWDGGRGCSLIQDSSTLILEKAATFPTAQRPPSLLHTRTPGTRLPLRGPAEEEPQNGVTGFVQLRKTPRGNGKSLSPPPPLPPSNTCTTMEVGSPHSQCKEAPQPLWKFLLDFLCLLSLVSAEQVAVGVPGAQERPWGDSVPTQRGPAWPVGAGEARGALGQFLCKFLLEEKQRKTRESHVCRETSEDRVGFPDQLYSRLSKLNPVVCGFLLAERRPLTAHGEGEMPPPGGWEPSVVSRITQSPE
ncbi:small integral membrane protein 35 isoform X1 [Vidua chalybeata]|uniref:small integral membrane protein 35 isoform X1 n=1 Tax=Vidua chalybeata TaxID=81927 RepID=UPI0023A87A97|nr:small integral membrane protein 35 isoform X1 [Vidua chalybeata]